jgi:perosamine synthetase
MTVPLFDCSLSDAVIGELAPVLQSGRLAAGPAVGALEVRLSDYLSDRSVVALSDMTQALALALRLAGVKPGDEVVTLALNCMSSNTAIALVGAVPVWVDVDPVTATIDPQDLAACIGQKTRAVVVYHLAGYVGDLGAVRALCDAHGLPLIEDANAALGAEWQGQRAGSIGDYAVFSFYANRQLNGIEGAALVCPNADVADHARRLRRFGIDTARFRAADGEIDPALDVPEIGIAASMNNVNATLAMLAFDDLDERLARTRNNVARLSERLADVLDLRFVAERVDARSIYWVALVRSAQRDRLMAALKAGGVQCSKLHQRNDGYSGFRAVARALPGTSALEQEMLALPSGWWLSQQDVDHIADVVRAALQ